MQNNPQDQADIGDILDEIVELTTPPFREQGDFTLQEYIAAWNRKNAPHMVSMRASIRRLDDMAGNGELTKRKGVYDQSTSRLCTVYKRMSKNTGG